MTDKLPPLPEPDFPASYPGATGLNSALYTADQMHTYARAALAQPADSGEPVAYWISKAEQFSIAKQGERPFAKAWQPLYAAPQPAPDQVEQAQALAAAFSRGHDAGWQSATAHHVAKQPARVPLTDEQIDQMFKDAEVGVYFADRERRRALEIYSFGVRDVETTHGIVDKE